MRLVLLGAPGSGKGTQAELITERYGLTHISTGDIFREHIKNDTTLGKKIKKAMDGGRLCPDDLTLEIVNERLSREDCKNGYLLDGFPRNLYQAKELDRTFAPDKIINLVVDTDIIERRLLGRRSCVECNKLFNVKHIGNVTVCPLCGGELITRKDDNPETVKERLSIYREQTEVLIDYYNKQGKLFAIEDADLGSDIVFGKVIKVLEND